MKNLFVSLIVLIAAIWAGSTWYVSKETEQRYDHALVEANTKMQEVMPFIKFEKEAYEKSFIKSEARTSMTLDGKLLDDEAEPVKVSFYNTIYHGPVMNTPEGVKIGLSYQINTLDHSSVSDDVKKAIQLMFSGAEPFKANVLIGFDGKVSSHIESNPLQIDNRLAEIFNPDADKASDKTVLKMGASSFDVNSDQKMTKMFAEGVLGAIDMVIDNEYESGSLHMAASTLEVDAKEIYKGSVLVGTSTIVFPEMSFKSTEDNTDIVMEGLSFSGSSVEEDKKLTLAYDFGMDKISIQGVPSQIPDAKFRFDGSVKGIEREAVIKMIDLGNKIRSHQMALVNDVIYENESEIDEAAILAMTQETSEYIMSVFGMLKQGVDIEKNLSISSSQGQASLNLDLSYIDAKALLDLTSLRDLIMALKGQLNIAVDKALLAGADLEQAVGMPVAMGFLEDKGNNYISEVNLAAGELLINGQPMPILEMLGPMVDEPLPFEEIKQAVIQDN